MDEIAKALWAKSDPYLPLWRHLLDAAAVCRALVPRFWPNAPIPLPWLCYIVALHDIGKADARFQGKDEDKGREVKAVGLPVASLSDCTGFRHEARSAEWLEKHLAKREWGEEARRTVAAAIRGHHGDFMAKGYDEEEYPHYVSAYGPLRDDLAEQVAQVLELDTCSFFPADFDAEDASRIGLLLSGLIVLSDWIASGEDPYGYHKLSETGDPAAHFAAARERAGEVIRKLELDVDGSSTDSDVPLRFADVWPRLDPRSSQQKLDSLSAEGRLSPGLVIVEAPMGEGKTEGAIFVSEEWGRRRGQRGAYIALPTQATSNQLHGRYAAFLGSDTAPRLVHGMAWLIDDKTPTTAPETHGDTKDSGEAQRAREWFANAKRALLATDGVGTVDQALMAALNVKHGFLRLFGLSRKTLVVDEVHAYDPFMTTILCRLLHWCRALAIPVVLLSATLSWEQKAQLVRAYSGRELPKGDKPEDDFYPLITVAPLSGDPFAEGTEKKPESKTVSLERKWGCMEQPEKIADLAGQIARDGGCVCVLVNTVRTAQETFRHLLSLRRSGALRSTKLFLFHGRFPASRRSQIERLVVNRFGKRRRKSKRPNPARPKQAILVATQVVEQSLDVDFDVMLTEWAPIDLLLQRSGREWRHGYLHPRHGRSGPVLHLLLPEKDTFPLGLTGRIYKNHEALLRTIAQVANRPAFSLPDDFRPLIEGCYGSAPFPEGVVPEERIEKGRQYYAKHRAHDEWLGGNHLIPEPDPICFAFVESRDAVDEGDEGENTNSNFRASTRLGDKSRPALILTDPSVIKAFRDCEKRTERETEAGNRRWNPGRKVLRKFFEQKVNLPARWLNAESAEGSDAFIDEPKKLRWLRRHVVVLAPGSVWRGTDEKGRSVTLTDDRDLGLVWTTPVEVEEDRDAD